MNAVTDKELNAFYGVEKTQDTRRLIIETITQTVRKVDHRALSVPYVKNNSNGTQAIDAYQLLEVVKDYGTDPKPLQALMAVLEGSDCKLVAKWREAMAELFADANAPPINPIITIIKRTNVTRSATVNEAGLRSSPMWLNCLR